MTKKDYIRLLETIALYLELKNENTFKVSAYRKAALTLEQLETSIDEIEDFSTLINIGKSVSEVLDEYREKGYSDYLKILEDSVPRGHIEMLQIRNFGAKSIAKIYKALGITTIEGLKEAAQNNEISALSGFGKKTEENLLLNIEDLYSKKGHVSIHEAVIISDLIGAELNKIKQIKKFDVAGSHRRMREFSKDLDFIVATKAKEEVSKLLSELPFIIKIEAQGNEKVSVVIKHDYIECAIDFRLVDESSYYHMLNHFTGSKEHNVKIRQLAKERDERVNEYGILKDEKLLKYNSELEIYQHFNLNYIPPEMRDDIRAFGQDLSDIVQLNDINGDLHMHTTASDGAYELEEMIEACIERGYDYLAITDHSHSLYVANGLSIDKLMKQHERIQQLKKSYKEINIYSGTEMDILPDGTLDYPEDVLQELDYVIAAIHQSFNQTETQIMHRLQAACYNPYVRQIAHPTGRLIGKRDGYPVNMPNLIELASKTNTVLEINAHPIRLDLSSKVLLEYPNIKLAINTDAHHVNHLDLMTYGVGTAIKGHVTKAQVINTMNKDDFDAWLKKGKN